VIKRLHHIGIAVNTLDDGAKTWTNIGLEEEGREDVVPAKTKVSMFPIGETRIELLEPMGDDTPVAKFLSKRGPGIHHICFEVDDVEAESARLQATGVRLLYAEPQPGAHGSRVQFLHPKDTGGVLIELNEFAADHE
jgi:methylmalonyl-CoA/ethylmalonyl-CoA epimerase